MQAIKFNKRLLSYILITSQNCGLFVCCFLIATLIEPKVFTKFFSAISLQTVENSPDILDKAGYYYDVAAYANMVIKDQCHAFYPMLSWLVRYLFNPQIFEQAVIGLKVISCICFIAGIPLIFKLFLSISQNSKLAYFLTLLYTASPMAIFRVIGYTEGIFALLSVVLLLIINSILDNPKTNQYVIYSFAFLTVVVMSLTRPVSLQLIFAACTSLITIILIEKAKTKLSWQELLQNNQYRYQNLSFLSLTITIATIIGYSFYGYLCLQSRGDFFAPFNDQKLWGKAIGFYPKIFLSLEYPLFEQMSLYFPLILILGVIICLYSFINSENINFHQIKIFVPPLPLFWCLISLYPSILILVYISTYLIYFINKRNKLNLFSINLANSSKAQKLLTNYTFWFCLYFVLSHILINLLTVDKLYSLARFTFSLPFFFVVLAYILRNFKAKDIDYILKWFLLVGTIALIEQWVRYGQNLWLG